METKDTLKIWKVLTFFVIIMFLNYIFGSLFDLKIIWYFNSEIKSFITDSEVLKLFSLLFYLLYVMIYAIFVTWILYRIFSVWKWFVLIHLNSLLILLLASSFLWINWLSLTYPWNYLKIMPFISIGSLLFFWIINWKLSLFVDNNINDTWLINSIKWDIKYSKWEAKWFFQSIKDVLQDKSNTVDIRYKDENENNNVDIMTQPNVFQSRFNNMDMFSNDDKKGIIDNDYIELPWDWETKDNIKLKEIDNFDIKPKDIKGLLKENRERIINPSSNGVYKDIVENPFENINDLNDINNFWIDIKETESPDIDTDYIDINEIEEDDYIEDNFNDEYGNQFSNTINTVNRGFQQEEIWENVLINDGWDKNETWKLSTMEILQSLGWSIETIKKNDENTLQNIDQEKYYVTWFITNSEQAVLTDLIKKL